MLWLPNLNFPLLDFLYGCRIYGCLGFQAVEMLNTHSFGMKLCYCTLKRMVYGSTICSLLIIHTMLEYI